MPIEISIRIEELPAGADGRRLVGVSVQHPEQRCVTDLEVQQHSAIMELLAGPGGLKGTCTLKDFRGELIAEGNGKAPWGGKD